MKKIFLIVFLSILMFSASYAAAASSDTEIGPIARTAISKTDFFKAVHPYPTEIEFNNAMARLQRAPKNWKRGGCKEASQVIGECCLAISTFGATSSLLLNGSYKKIRPYVEYMQSNIFNPLISSLKRSGEISSDSQFGILLTPTENRVLGFAQDSEGDYQIMPLTLSSSDPVVLEPCHLADRSKGSTLTFLTAGSSLILEPGLLVDRGGSRDLRILKYYGNLRMNNIALCARKTVHPICDTLLTLLGAHKNLFIPFPQTPKDSDSLSLLLIKDLAREQDPDTQQANLRLLEAYGFFEDTSQGSPPLLLSYIFAEEASAIPEAAKAAEGPAPSRISEKPYQETMADLEKKITTPLETEFRDQIRREQEAIREKVAKAAQDLGSEKATSKKHQQKERRAQTQTAAAAAEPDFQEELSEEQIERQVKKLMQEYSLKSLDKFRNLRPVLSSFFKDTSMGERTRGSHHTVKGAAGRSITIAHHGANDVVPVVAILRDLLRSFERPQ